MDHTAQLTDLEIVEVYKVDKREGFRLLYRKYSERIFAICRRYSSDREGAMDFFQEAMIKINDKICSVAIKEEGSIYSWMYRVAVNLILDKLRREKKRQKVEIREFCETDYTDPLYDDFEGIPVEVLYEMIGRLSVSKRAVFNMYAIDGYSYKEIAELMGISEDGASSMMSKARKDLGKMVKDYLMENQ